MDLTDEQWRLLEPLIREPERRADGKGRPRRAAKEVLEGILWILRTGAQWADLPERYHRIRRVTAAFRNGCAKGVLRGVLEALAQDLKERGQIDLSECFIDATFVVAKKGDQRWERPSGAKARRSWQYQTLLALVSPSTLALLRHMNSPLYTRLSHLDMSKARQSN